MLTQASNYHHSKLPAIGALVRVHVGNFPRFENPERFINKCRKALVIAYPLNDNAVNGFSLGYSRGIHSCWVKFLDTQQIKNLAWQWLYTIEDSGFVELLYL
jgi:hypothetical protein